jgi:AraC-like DNA-binding protein
MSIDINKNTPATNKQPISYINKLMLEKNYRMLLLERDTIKNILYNLKLELKRAQD